jgi:hypothetical protein
VFTTNSYEKGVTKNVIVEPKVAKCQFDPPNPPNALKNQNLKTPTFLLKK